MSIPLSYLVSVSPSVIDTGAPQNNLFGLMLSQSPLIPPGRVLTFTTPDDVGTIFGLDSLEYQQAVVYFGGYKNSTLRATTLCVGAMSISSEPLQAALWGGNLAGLTLEKLATLKGTLILTINGTPTTATVDLTGVTSFSQAASKLQTAIWSKGTAGTVSWNIGLAAFIITAPAPQENDQVSTITTATGTIADDLGLSTAKGGIVVDAIAEPTPTNIMELLRTQNQQWAAFFCAFDPQQIYLELAAWTDAQNNSVMACLHDTTLAGMSAAAISTATTLYDQVVQKKYSGIFGLNNDPLGAAFAASIYAAANFLQANGMVPFAGRKSDKVPPTVTSRQVAAALEAKGINWVGDFAGADDRLSELQAGSISGDFAWADAYMAQIWLNRRCQHLLVALLGLPRMIPYTRAGNTLISSQLTPAINDAISFGLIVPGVTLSEDQTGQIATQYGPDVLTALQNNGYVLLVAMQEADPAIRGKRQTIPVTLLYTQGGSVQRLNLNSIEIK